MRIETTGTRQRSASATRRLPDAALRIVLSIVLVLSMLTLSGCASWFEGDIFDQIHAWLEKWANEGEGGEMEGDELGNVELRLTTPAGASPNVFTTGWVFGARATITDEDGARDISDRIEWSGSGSFSPDTGSISRPSFNGPGMNTIVISVKAGGETYTQSFNVSAVSPAGYAAVGDIAMCDADAHGCLADPHPVRGPIATGSPNVFVGGRPAARVGDVGNHAACCGSNTFEISGGDSSVMINGRPAAKIGSSTKHCGGVGTIVGGGG